MPGAYYNENDPAAAHTLRTLIRFGLLPSGEVDDRSIKDVQPHDLTGFDQCHFFAGMGGWPFAARLAERPDSWRWWSASCPCQGESVAGKKLGADDPRHLWPDLFRLIRACRPTVIVGEQVARAAGTHWLDGVCADLGNAGYAARAVDLTAQAVDAPHQRQRLYWCAVADGDREGKLQPEGLVGKERRWPRDGNASGVADADGGGHPGRPEDPQRRSIGRDAAERADGVAQGDATRERWREGWPEYEIRRGRNAASRADARGVDVGNAAGERRSQAFGESGDGPSPDGEGPANRAERLRGVNGNFYADAEWVICADGKARRAKPGVPMLVDGLAGRTDLWRMAGNGLVLGLAAEVIAALADVMVEA